MAGGSRFENIFHPRDWGDGEISRHDVKSLLSQRPLTDPSDKPVPKRVVTNREGQVIAEVYSLEEWLEMF